MSLNHFRTKRVLQEVDELRRANGMEVNRERMEILNRSWIEASCDIPLVTADVLNRSDAFAVLLIRWLAQGSCAGRHSARIHLVHV